MGDRRKQRKGISAIVRRLRRQTALVASPPPPVRPEAVEPGEVALILLTNAARLLNETAVPAEVKLQLEKAIEGLKAFLAERSC